VSEVNHALWAGRFAQPIADVAHRFSSSIALDGKLWREDIRGSIAHARMLGETGIIPSDDADQIIDGLNAIAREIETGIFQFDDSMEDVHLVIEHRLTEKIGAVGGKLHTGRSRNDQVALDERLYLKTVIPQIIGRAFDLISALLDQAEAHVETLMPGYTHMQRAQPVLLSHHLLAYVEMFGRDIERLRDCLSRLDRSPLGAAAFAGTSYPIDREAVSNELGFAAPVANSIDAVSDRDYLIELASACSIVMMHLSRMAEELVLWSTTEFGFVTMSDAVTTGSSIMPQKKNPDMAELVRGKVGRVYGSLINLLTMMKGLPLAYNRDMQEDKAPMFEAITTTHDSLEVMAFVIRETTFNRERLQQATDQGYLTATEIADYLVRKRIPFREAHYITGRIVASAELREQSLRDLPIETLRSFSDRIESDIYRFLDPATSVSEKRSSGSTNPELIRNAIDDWRSRLALTAAR
jgi:argininosuccinate lyase